MQKFCQFLLKCFGWEIVGQLPEEKKYILIVAPHTSNWDVVLGLVAQYAVGGRFSFLAKHQAFFFPLGFIMRAFGAIPVHRDTHHQVVDQAVELFAQKDAFVLGLAPEGTRSPVKRWKTGFYHIACKAKIPIAMVGFDYVDKKIVVREAFWPTGDLPKDFTEIFSFYRKIKGRYPKEIPEEQS